MSCDEIGTFKKMSYRNTLEPVNVLSTLLKLALLAETLVQGLERALFSQAILRLNLNQIINNLYYVNRLVNLTKSIL